MIVQKADNKECGACSMCCKLMQIDVPELKKPANQWCHHCKPGAGGCTIYDSRPKICEEYVCMWLADPVMADNLRPDKSKVVFSMGSHYDVVQCFVDPGFPSSWLKGHVNEYIEKLRANGFHVIVIKPKGDRVFLNGFGTALPPEVQSMIEHGDII